jgi:hypothetical protein
VIPKQRKRQANYLGAAPLVEQRLEGGGSERRANAHVEAGLGVGGDHVERIGLAAVAAHACFQHGHVQGGHVAELARLEENVGLRGMPCGKKLRSGLSA